MLGAEKDKDSNVSWNSDVEISSLYSRNSLGEKYVSSSNIKTIVSNYIDKNCKKMGSLTLFILRSDLFEFEMEPFLPWICMPHWQNFMVYSISFLLDSRLRAVSIKHSSDNIISYDF